MYPTAAVAATAVVPATMGTKYLLSSMHPDRTKISAMERDVRVNDEKNCFEEIITER